MKTENCASDPVWSNSVELLPNEECLPVIGSCQVSSILSTLAPPHDKLVQGNPDMPQAMDIIILQNADYKVSNIEMSNENNYMVLKDSKCEDKSSNSNKYERNANFEDLLYFVCNLCSFLCTDNMKIAEHLESAHSTKNTKKKLQLKCPACPNIFFHKISLRSHLIHDHSVNNSDINCITQAVIYYASTKNSSKTDKRKSKIRNLTSSGNLNEINQNEYTDKLVAYEKIFRNEDVSISYDAVNGKTSSPSTSPSNHNYTPKVINLPPVNIDASKSEQSFDSPINSVSKLIDQKKMPKCLCPSCKVRLHDVNKMHYHVRCHKEGGFKCLECEQEFSLWKPLTGHLWRCHKIDMELFACNQCDYKTFSLGKLNNVHKLIHGNVRSFVCNVCQKGFKNNKQLRNHKVIHKERSEKLVHVCEICSRKFSDRRQVRLHIDIVHKKIKPYLCNFCGYKGSSRSSLKIHIRQHTGEKPFACDSCNYTTADHNSLRRHKLQHTGLKPYKCAYCSYACIQSSTYKVHLKTKHPGQEKDLMYTCHECQFRSVNKKMYITHVVTVHKQEPQP